MTKLRLKNLAWSTLLLAGCGGSIAADPTEKTDPAAPEAPPAGTATGAEDPGTPPAPVGANTSPPAPTGANPPPPAPTGANTPPPTPTATNAPPPVIAGSRTLTLKTDFFDIAPGGEAFKCQNFTNPFGQDVDIVMSESRMTSGSHHMFVFKQPGATDGPIQDCSGLEFKEYVHSAQTPTQRATYPEGVGRFVSGGDGLRILAHYLNPTSDPIHAQVEVEVEYVDPSEVTAHAAEIFLNKLSINVSPGEDSETASYTVPYDIKLLAGVSHMHQRGVHFTSKTSDGRVLYEGSDWNEPEPAVFPEGLDISAGTKITFTCEYQNDTGRTLTFGESAAVNEMCIFSGTFFPAPNGTGLSAQIFF